MEKFMLYKTSFTIELHECNAYAMKKITTFYVAKSNNQKYHRKTSKKIIVKIKYTYYQALRIFLLLTVEHSFLYLRYIIYFLVNKKYYPFLKTPTHSFT